MDDTPYNPAKMSCEMCEHPLSRHAPAEGKRNAHYCTVCKKECDFGD